jgi:ankyrin repeat protein
MASYHTFWNAWEDGDVSTLAEAFKGAPQECKDNAWYGWNAYEFHTADIMKQLLEIGADPNFEDCDGWSLLELVLEWGGDEECLKLLEKYHATLKVKEPVAQRAVEKGGYQAELMGRCEIVSWPA